MKLSSLRNFIVITRCGSFTNASEQLLISQPTLSRQIRDLEQELGVSLYERTKDGLQLSEAGETLMVEAVEIVERCDRLSRLFHPAAESRKVTHEVLKIGFQTFFNIEDLRAILDRFRVTETETEIVLLQAGLHELEYGIQYNRFDIVVSLQSYYERISGLRILPYKDNCIQVAVPSDHPMAGRKSVRMEELIDEPFIMLKRDSSPIIFDRIISRCVVSGFSPHVSAYVKSEEEGLHLVEANQGIAFVHSQMLVDGFEKMFHVHCLDIEEGCISEPLALICKARNVKKSLQRLLEELDMRKMNSLIR